MKDIYRVPIIVILGLIFALILVSACTQTIPPPLSTAPGQTPGPQNIPGQPGEIPAGQTCPQLQIWCNGRCVDPATDMGNCGGCMNPCQPGQPCISGKCGSEVPGVPGTPGIPGVPDIPGTPGIMGTPGIPGTPAVTGTPVTPGTTKALSCTSGQTNCYGSCADLQSDATHCGACTIKCASGKVCSAGSCTISCSAGQDNCAGSCINTQTSSQHCGKCSNPCSWGQTCEKGKCGLYASVMTIDPKQICTSSGKLWCSGTCVSQDSSNCGSCGYTCDSGEPCSEGKCLSWTGTWNTGNSLVTLSQTGTSVKGSSMMAVSGWVTATYDGTTSGNPPKFVGTCKALTTTPPTIGTVEIIMSQYGDRYSATYTFPGFSTTTEHGSKH